MPILAGVSLADLSGVQLLDASGNELAEPDTDMAWLKATLVPQSDDILARIGAPASTLFTYAESTNAAVLPLGALLADIVEAVATALGIIETLQDILGTSTGDTGSILFYTANTWEQVGLGDEPPWPKIPVQIDQNTTAILNAVADLADQTGTPLQEGGTIGPVVDRELFLTGPAGDFLFAPGTSGVTVVPQAPTILLTAKTEGQTRQQFLDTLLPDYSFSHFDAGGDLLSSRVYGGLTDWPRWYFRYTEEEWDRVPAGGGGSADILAAIADLRGGTATVQNAYDNVEGARSDLTLLRGVDEGANITDVQAAIDALPIPPNASTIAAAVWAEVLSGTSAGARLITASGYTFDLTPVTDAISALRGGTATVQQVLDAVNGLDFPDVPTANDVAAAVWAYVLTTIAAGTRLVTASTYIIPKTPPAWPGLAGVTLGEATLFNDSFSLSGTMHGVILNLSTLPSKLGVYNLGGKLAYYGLGRIAFINDRGDLEPWQYCQFGDAVYMPRTMTVAAGVYVQVGGGAEGSATPFTIT